MSHPRKKKNHLELKTGKSANDSFLKDGTKDKSESLKSRYQKKSMS